jgi:2-oxoisovalerate dehydrogenase E1 component
MESSPRTRARCHALARDQPRARGRARRASPRTLIFGEDVGRKGGVYGVTKGLLKKRFGAGRVFDTLLDEQSILGLALGAAVSGCCRSPRSSTSRTCTTPRTSCAARPRRCVLLQRPVREPDARAHRRPRLPEGLRRPLPQRRLRRRAARHPGPRDRLARAARRRGGDAPHAASPRPARTARVCVYLEPIALYHTRDLHEDGDGLARPYPAPRPGHALPLGKVGVYGDGEDALSRS